MKLNIRTLHVFIALYAIFCFIRGEEIKAEGIKIYVSVSGNDENPGTRVERSSCLGLCDRAPAALVMEKQTGPLTSAESMKIKTPIPQVNNYSLPLPGEMRVMLAHAGEINPESIESALNYGVYWDDLPEMIIIGIHQNHDGERYDDSTIDQNQGVPFEKGAEFFEFIGAELVPYIEKQYRTNSNRIFWGASLGATVGEILLSQETDKKPYFSTYALSDGAFWANPPEIQEKLKTALAQPKSETISIFTSGTRQGNYITNLDFVNRVQGLNNSTLDIKNIELKETHNEMATPTFEYFIDAMH